MGDQPGKLHIDDDWKSEAAAEKAKLSEDLETQAGQAPLPEGGFPAIVQMLAMQAMIGLGGFAQGDQQIPPNPEIAKLHIDMLDTLEQKTRGNLDEAEKRLLDTTLHQLRMAYIEMVGGGPATPPTGG